MKKLYKAVMFDMDGVLIDSIPSTHKAREELLARYGVATKDVYDPQHEQHKGTSLKTLLGLIEQQYGLMIDIEEFSEEFVRCAYQDLKDRNVAAEPSLITLLDDLHYHNVKLAITSSGRAQSVDKKLEILGIRDYFDVIISGDDVAEHKPSPQPYLITAAKLGVEPKECIVFEDSLTGVQSGLAAGCTVIAFTKFNQERVSFPDGVTTIADWNEVSSAHLRESSV